MNVYSIKTGECVKVLEASKINCKQILSVLIFEDKILLFTVNNLNKNELLSFCSQNLNKIVKKDMVSKIYNFFYSWVRLFDLVHFFYYFNFILCIHILEAYLQNCPAIFLIHLSKS